MAMWWKESVVEIRHMSRSCLMLRHIDLVVHLQVHSVRCAVRHSTYPSAQQQGHVCQR